MFPFSRWSMAGFTLLASSLVVGAIATAPPRMVVAQESQAAFPDTANHWAQPFIARLADRNILAGYPDGTFRPNEQMDRDEFASVVQAAFNQDAERQISSGSTFQDVPQGYWAAPAIEDAYQMGFMNATSEGGFNPKQPLTRLEALVSLAQNLNLGELDTTATPDRQVQAAPQTQPTATAQDNRRPNRRQVMLPMAMTSLMQPFVIPRSQAATTPARSASPQPDTAVQSQPPVQAQPTAANIVQNTFTDTARIPSDAVAPIAKATQAGIVVNYPEPRVLNPNQPATRGDIAAFVHQALVDQGRIEPIARENQAANYIVAPK